MTARSPLRAAARALAAAAIVVPACAAACGGPRRPAPPPPDRDPLTMFGGARPEAEQLADLIARYPLGDRPMRADLLVATDAYSAFLVQTRRGVPPHFHRTHRERATVLSGSGTCYVDARSYPAVAGSAFRIEPGLVHRVDASGDDAPIVALVVFEPPVRSFDEDRVPVGN